MNADEILFIRDVRRMFDKLPIDSQRMEVQTVRGHVTLSGTIKAMRSHPTENVKELVDEAEKRLRKDPRVKTLTVSCRYVQIEKKEHEHFAPPEPQHHDPLADAQDSAV